MRDFSPLMELKHYYLFFSNIMLDAVLNRYDNSDLALRVYDLNISLPKLWGLFLY